MTDPNTLLAWGCIFLGLYLSGYALRSLLSGRTRGYYRDHSYERDEEGSAYGRWVWGRLVLGLICFVAGVAFV